MNIYIFETIAHAGTPSCTTTELNKNLLYKNIIFLLEKWLCISLLGLNSRCPGWHQGAQTTTPWTHQQDLWLCVYGIRDSMRVPFSCTQIQVNTSKNVITIKITPRTEKLICVQCSKKNLKNVDAAFTF